MAKKVKVTTDLEDAVEYLVESLRKWRSDEKSLTVPQFLHTYKIGWSTLSDFMAKDPLLKNEFEITLALLSDRWLQYGLSSKLLPRHMEKAFARYLTLYDDHLWDKETEQKKSVAKSEVSTVMDYVAEDYAKVTLEGLYHELYKQNDKKRKLDV